MRFTNRALLKAIIKPALGPQTKAEHLRKIEKLLIKNDGEFTNKDVSLTISELKGVQITYPGERQKNLSNLKLDEINRVYKYLKNQLGN